MSRPEDDPDLRLLLGLALRKQVVRADWPRVLRAAETARRFPFVAAALDGVPFDLLPEQVGWLREPLRRSLQRALPDDPALLAEQLGLSARQAQVLLVVLRGSTIGEAAATVVRLDGVGISKEQASRWMTHAADRLTVWLLRRAAQPVKPDRDDRVDDYLRALAEHCSALPPWFPLGLRFSQVQQEVLVVPPADPDVDDEDYRATGGRNGAEPQAGAGVRARPLPWTTALQRFQHVLLVGEPGSGKSWAARGRCLDSATALLASGSSGDPVPVLVIAPRLEDRLGRRADVPAEELPELIASSMPEVLAADERTRTCVADLLRSGEPVELLIDGFDEIRDERPAVARHLPAVVEFLARSGSRFVLTTRPSSVPQYRFTSRTTTCELQPFGEREQLAFVDAWFTDRRERADQVKRWVVGRRLDLLRTPLLIALFCAVADGSSDAPPRSEPDLLHHVLRRLASDEDRHDSLDRRSSVVRARIDVLEQIALSYVANDGLRDAAEISVVEASLTGTPAWSALEALRTAPTVLDDLVATGLVRATEGRRELELEFLHSAVRDYLLARALHRRATWGEYLGRIWAQPEWEPVLAYVAALLDDPDALLLELERRFGDDPLNAARFTAGRALATAVAPVSVERRTRTRDELLILLGSHDALDRSRSAALLAALQDPETAALVRGLVHPSVPTRVVEAALRSVAGGTSTESVNALALCALDPAFTNGERETAVGALAEVGTAEALAVLELVARDAGVQPAVRAAAAFTALRRLDAASAARELLQSEDDERRDVRWSLAERLSVQAAGLEDVLAAATPNGVHVPDPYCRALLATARAAPEEAQRMLAAALPPNDALDLLVGAVELLRTAAERDPTIVTAARFLLDPQQHRRLRWRVAVAVHACRPTTARALWDHLDAELDPRDGLTVAEFVVEDLDRLPPTVASLVRAQVEAGDFGMWTVAALQTADGRPPLADEEPPPAPAAAAPEPEPDLTTLLSASASLPGYWLLREQRRSIPGAGPLREQAASLTHAIAAVDATAWVEAQPGAA
ncbi:MAG: NACHT domain-containing protein, partial [Actinomycetota bacterium]|nr:NACHT domain-containing protein [Actinomycetota bacterium]